MQKFSFGDVLFVTDELLLQPPNYRVEANQQRQRSENVIVFP